MKPIRIIILMALAAVIMLPAYIIFVISPAITGAVEENAKEESVRVASHLVSQFSKDGGWPEAGNLPEDFRSEVNQIERDFRGMKLKFYSPSGEVVFATDPSHMGQTNSEAYFRSIVAGGNVYSKIVRKATKTLEDEMSASDVAETYVPVMRGGIFLGAFEIYYDVSGAFGRLNKVMAHSYALLLVTVLGLLAATLTAAYRAGRSLRERDLARQEWEQTFDAVTDPVMILDSNFRMRRVNKAMAEFLNVTKQEAVGMTCYQRVHCADEPVRGCPHKMLLRDGKVHTEEIYEPRAGKHLEVTVFPILDAGGGLISTVHYAKDISKRKKAEEALKAAEAKYRIVADNTYAWEFWVGQDGRYIYTSPSCKRVTGYQPEDFASQPEMFLQIVHPDDRQEVIEHQKASLEGSMHGEIEFRIVRKDGAVRWISHICQPVLDSEGKSLGLRGSNSDITGRKDIDEVLKKSASRLDEAQRISKIGSWELDLKSSDLTWSDEVYRIFQLDPSPFVASYQAFLDLVHPDDRAFVDQTYTNSVRNRTNYDIVHRLLMKDGSIKHLHERCETFYDADGAPLRSVGTIQDITERKRDEEMLQRQLKYMTALSDMGIAISSSLDLRATLKLLLERLISHLGIDATALLLLDPDSLYLSCAADLGFRGAGIRNTRVRLGKGHAGLAAYERRTHIVHDLGDTLTNSLREEAFRYYIAVPLVTQGTVKGVLEIFHRKPLDPPAEWLGFLELMAAQAAIAIDNATMFESLQRTNTELTLSYDATLEGWGRTLEFRDEDTMGHTERVAEMTVRFARELGVEDRDIVHVRRGALLHDIGKISIPDHILLKPGLLSPEEREIMNRHPEYAFQLLQPIPFLRQALDIPYCHHEKWDGSGFPRGLKGKEIPFASRIFSIVDVCDALLSDRPYRSAWPVEKVREYISSRAGTEFDPSLVSPFLKLLDATPLRSETYPAELS